MARYRAKAQLYVGTRLINPGDLFNSDLEPGLQWEPVDENGKSIAPGGDPGTIDIPNDWRDLTPEKRISLARRLGAPVKGTDKAAADAKIEAELARRAGETKEA
jgi:hypothetical protein